MKIADVKTWAVATPPHKGGAYWIFVKLTTDNGISGYGEVYGVPFAPHLYAGPIEAAANIQLSACSPNFLILESIEIFDGFFNQLLTRPIKWEEGYVAVPDEPGLGFELNEEFCDANPYTNDAVFPPMAKRPLG